MKQPAPFGKYMLLERINVGGMAEVFRAKAFGVEGFERLVAVKRILSNVAEDKEFIRMFIEEAKLSVQLNHANIAQIFDLGVVEGSYYIALEHVHGRDLRGIFDRCHQLGEAMPVAQACFIAMKVCEGLDYAHNKRDQAGHELALVHRDVSPQNILVSFEGEVKLIDFGIAKAAGIGSTTQAGILKGKFGYMSPEQVRGVQVDRRSDVFSCGIVLYELLTGERLFVGESDFSTLEKVRNVEILPPSTYNRRIPEELERIVLKALTKDVEDRFQNAIDLHDELQAFVYTAGEFYSRKDLAGWMKKTFGKEIEDETAKLESYRQLRPPAAEPAGRSGGATTPPPRKPPVPVAADAGSRSQPVPVVDAAPRSQPISVMDASWATPVPLELSARSQPVPVIEPSARSQPVLVIEPVAEIEPAAPIDPGRSQPVPVAVVDPPSVRSLPVAVLDHPDQPAGPAADTTAPLETIDTVDEVDGSLPAPSPLDPASLGWDDDEVETQLYADQDHNFEHKPPQRPGLPLQPPLQSSPAIALSAGFGFEAPRDVMALGHAGNWDHGDRTEASSSGGFPEMSVSGGTQLGIASAPTEFPSGSNNVDPRFAPRPRRDSGTGSGARELSAARVLVSATPPSDLPYDPMAAFGARITGAARTPDQRRGFLMVALGGGAVAVVTMIVVILLSGGSKLTAQVAPPPPAPKPVVVTADPNTGFDLYVVPSGLTKWKLDGESRTDRLPSRIRGISVGLHSVQIEPPPGFLSQLQQVAVEQGKAPKVEIKLQPIPGIVGTFESTPPATAVSLIVDGQRQLLGPSPAKAALDPRSSYQVLFEKPGFVSVNRPISFSGGLDERVAVQLEKASAEKPAIVEPRPQPQPQPQPQRRVSRPPERTTEKPASEPSSDPGDPAPSTGAADPKMTPDPDARAKPQGVLVLGSKPPCEIYVDGNPTGLRTPQKEIKLSVGRHRITLVNNEFGIRETFNVDIKPDAPEKQIKDYSDRLPH